MQRLWFNLEYFFLPESEVFIDSLSTLGSMLEDTLKNVN